MEKFNAFDGIRSDIRKKLDEHVEQILEKPTISVDEHHLLELVYAKYAEMEEKMNSSSKGSGSNWWLPILLFLATSGFGGEK